MVSISNQITSKRRLGKGWIVLLVVLGLLIAVFFPKKLSWLCPLDKATYYCYFTDNHVWLEDSNSNTEVRYNLTTLRENMDNTWVIWTGWADSIPAADAWHLFFVSDKNGYNDYLMELKAAASEVKPGLSVLSPYLDNKHTIYQPVFGRFMNRYVSLGDTLFELIPT